ncbi:uncharacterized protein [Heterodontus francisci]|uniref:uncharacterized protein isoform X2 n=1 Tax=Heterodontus francisci TaxID=7792 RepID=UPI00355B9395
MVAGPKWMTSHLSTLGKTEALTFRNSSRQEQTCGRNTEREAVKYSSRISGYSTCLPGEEQPAGRTRSGEQLNTARGTRPAALAFQEVSGEERTCGKNKERGAVKYSLRIAACSTMDSRRFILPSREADCMKYIDMFPECLLPSKPVCGNNGVTYKNECQLCVNNWKFRLNIKIHYNGEC